MCKSFYGSREQREVWKKGHENDFFHIGAYASGRVIYKLKYEKRTEPMYLLKAGENMLVFIDPAGNLLVGNADFSYTLNRAWKERPQ